MSEHDRPTIGLVVPSGHTPTSGSRVRIWHKPGCPSRAGRDSYSGLETGCTCDESRAAAESPPRPEPAPARTSATCAFCGDSAAHNAPTGARHVITIIRPITGLNERRVNQGASRHAYSSERKAWELEIQVAMRNHGIPAATGPRRVEIIRYIAAPNALRRKLGRAAAQLMDYGNLVGGCKVVLDALTKNKLIVDDDPVSVRDHYRQIISDYDTDFDRVDVILTDLVENTP